MNFQQAVDGRVQWMSRAGAHSSTGWVDEMGCGEESEAQVDERSGLEEKQGRLEWRGWS